MLPTQHILQQRRLETLVENQTSYALEQAEMHLFETHQQAERVQLRFGQPVLATMLQGKKIMHVKEANAFDFLPGESLILPSDELMCIDFPEATMDTPTRCLAMTIDAQKIQSTVDFLNESQAKSDGTWQFADYNFHFTNDAAIHQIIHRLLFLFTEDHPSKDLFADFMLRELIVRILQAETKKIYTEQTLQLSSSHRLAYVVQYIREHIREELTINTLSKQAHMSESNFYRVFRNELQCSPTAFINNERLKLATSLLRNPSKKVKEVYLECGFNSLSYFVRQFKKKEHCSPKAYQLRHQA